MRSAIPASAKWTLAFIATGIFGALFLKSSGRAMRAIGGLNLIAALLGFYGLYDNAFLVWPVSRCSRDS